MNLKKGYTANLKDIKEKGYMYAGDTIYTKAVQFGQFRTIRADLYVKQRLEDNGTNRIEIVYYDPQNDEALSYDFFPMKKAMDVYMAVKTLEAL